MRIKKYLSYSQYQCFRQSKAQYIKRYIENIQIHSKYIEFGKLIAEGLENRKKTKDKNIILARKLIPKPKESEKEIRVKFGNIPLFGYLDGYNHSHIQEQKTSINKWTQKMVDNNEQLTFYAIMVSEKFGIPIEKINITLDWLPTFEDTDGSLHLTGEKLSFETNRTPLDKIKIYPKMRKAWEGIEELINSLNNN